MSYVFIACKVTCKGKLSVSCEAWCNRVNHWIWITDRIYREMECGVLYGYTELYGHTSYSITVRWNVLYERMTLHHSFRSFFFFFFQERKYTENPNTVSKHKLVKMLKTKTTKIETSKFVFWNRVWIFRIYQRVMYSVRPYSTFHSMTHHSSFLCIYTISTFNGSHDCIMLRYSLIAYLCMPPCKI